MAATNHPEEVLGFVGPVDDEAEATEPTDEATDATAAPDPQPITPTLQFIINFRNIYANMAQVKGGVSIKTAQDLVALAAQNAALFTQIELAQQREINASDPK